MAENGRENGPVFSAGKNIALKIPPHQFAATVAFYRDVLGLQLVDEFAPAIVVEFGAIRLWIDRTPALSQAELWLEIETPDAERAAAYLDAQGVTRCDAIEGLPEGFDGLWIMNPAGIVHLVNGSGAGNEK
ncbi:MAG: hypothetical protein H7X91_07745 [Burkholderiales bacterium]|nr:hypothetical protein [Burkholderiales bacterium]